MNGVQWYNAHSFAQAHQAPFDGMDLLVLGTSSAVAGRFRSTSAYALRLHGRYPGRSGCGSATAFECFPRKGGTCVCGWYGGVRVSRLGDSVPLCSPGVSSDTYTCLVVDLARTVRSLARPSPELPLPHTQV